MSTLQNEPSVAPQATKASLRHRVSEFLKSHVLGIFLFAIVTGVVGNFVYDAVKPERKVDHPLPEPVNVPFDEIVLPHGYASKIQMDHKGAGDLNNYSPDGVDTSGSLKLVIENDSNGVPTVYLRGQIHFMERNGDGTEWEKSINEPLKQFPKASDLKFSIADPHASFSIFRPLQNGVGDWNFGTNDSFPTGRSSSNFIEG